MNNALYVAVDLGAGSGRVMLAGMAPGELRLDEIRRFTYPMEKRDGHLRWPFGHILAEIELGLGQAAVAAKALGRPIRSVGVDTWGVDYGFIDAHGALVEDPITYRDDRTADEMAAVFARLPRSEVFARTGIQFLVFNSLFQLHAHRRAGLPARGQRLMMMADLIHHHLCGKVAIEYSNATTTQMVNAQTGTWDPDLLRLLDLPAGMLPEIVPSGADLGGLRPELATSLGLQGVRVVAPATHDTGSAVVGAPLQAGWAYISSGTWSLVGVERDQPLINADVARENFTNEGGAYGTIRFLKNVMGLWLLESCRKEWQAQNRDVAYGTLLEQVAALPVQGPVVCPDDQRLFNPQSMLAALSTQLTEAGQTVPESPAAMTKVILDSLALRYARVLQIIERLTGQTVAGIQIVGGGCQNDYLNQATADAAGKPVLAGPVEATAGGNVMVQAIAAGQFAGLAEARTHVRECVSLRRFTTDPTRFSESTRRQYAAAEARLLAG
ncbi:MAG: rhamnulokinase family protein [Deltaproteobacteria bacterium]|nr:rhamnulokinase family protein [Deltaproteobacteria bacterium]